MLPLFSLVLLTVGVLIFLRAQGKRAATSAGVLGLVLMGAGVSDNTLAAESLSADNQARYSVTLNDYKTTLAPSESDYQLSQLRQGKMDNDNVIIARYQPEDSNPVNYGGAHVSVVVTPSNKLKGFTRMNPY